MSKKLHNTISSLLLFILYISVNAQTLAQHDSLEQKIQRILEGKQVLAGVAVEHLESGYKLSINNEAHYPMQSVYKFHLALCVLEKTASENILMDQLIHIGKKDLLPNTWSPLRDKYPGGDISLPLLEIIRYTVSESDNNGCDILFRYMGGTATVNNYIHRYISDICIEATEEEMHRDWETQFRNWCTPSSATDLLVKFFRKEILKGNQYDTLWKYMTETVTGPNRIRGLLPKATVVAHKTGSSGRSDSGIIAAVNDIGIVCLPNGEHLAIAVFISNSAEDFTKNEQIIAEITREIFNFFK